MQSQIIYTCWWAIYCGAGICDHSGADGSGTGDATSGSCEGIVGGGLAPKGPVSPSRLSLRYVDAYDLEAQHRSTLTVVFVRKHNVHSAVSIQASTHTTVRQED